MNTLTFAEMKQMAELFAKSGTFSDAREMAVAFVKIQAGAELGFGPFASMNAFDIIKGKVVMNAGGQAIKVKASGRYDYQVLEHTDQACEIEFFELEPGSAIGRTRSLGKSRFTMEDAKRAKLDVRWDKDLRKYVPNEMYEKFPRNMLFSRAMTNGVAWYCPDAIGMRVYGEGELSDAGPAPAAGSPITAAPSFSPSSEPAPASLPAPPKTLSDAIGQRAQELKPGQVEAGGQVYESKAAHQAEVDRIKAGIQDAIAYREGLPRHPMDAEEEWQEEDKVEAKFLAGQVLLQLKRLIPGKPGDEGRAGKIKDLVFERFGLQVEATTGNELAAELIAKVDASALAIGLDELKKLPVQEIKP